LIFLSELNSDENGYHFISTNGQLVSLVLMAHQQELIDVLSIFYPTYGVFEDGMFIPKLDVFYIVWIALTLFYFLCVTWLTVTRKYLIYK
jgi:hypothetical protein